jgi:hypothetical protein
MDYDEKARELADSIAEDIGDRRGLKWEWRQIDDDIRESILAEWTRMAAAALRDAHAAGAASERAACAAVAWDHAREWADKRDRADEGGHGPETIRMHADRGYGASVVHSAIRARKAGGGGDG